MNEICVAIRPSYRPNMPALALLVSSPPSPAARPTPLGNGRWRGPDGGSPSCGPSTCATCCRPNGTCAPTGQLDTECGSAGLACTSCGAGTCSAAGACVAPPTGCSVSLPSVGPASDTCTGAEICICPNGPDSECSGTGTCVVASGRMYLVELDYVYADTTNPQGDAWDIAGGAPDPFAVLRVNDVVRGTSTAIDDTFDAQWFPAPAWTVTLTAGSSVRVDAYDEDTTVHDWLGG
ncbi:MAG: hypothetical protein IPN77_18850 [Sandaracinaceae bacterium]|nr:hypothetical protein [Sandaracinaceae bacterium]